MGPPGGEGDIVEQISVVSRACDELIAQLDGLSRSDDLGPSWSSQVARGQSRLADRLVELKERLFDLEVYVDEECAPGSEAAARLQQGRAGLEALQQRQRRVQQSLAGASARLAEQRRQRLLSGAEPVTPAASTADGAAGAMAASQSITAGLQRTARAMAEELELADGNLCLISASERKLAASSAEYERQHGVLGAAQRLLLLIRWQARREDVLLFAGIAFFGSCVAFVVLRRTLHFVPALPALPRWRGARLPGTVGPCMDGGERCASEL